MNATNVFGQRVRRPPLRGLRSVKSMLSSLNESTTDALEIYKQQPD